MIAVPAGVSGLWVLPFTPGFHAGGFYFFYTSTHVFWILDPSHREGWVSIGRVLDGCGLIRD